MPKALLRLNQYLLIVAMFAACGGHWLVLQSVAWSGMIVEYSRTAGLVVGVEKTFDGQHPCDFCKVIQKSRHSEQTRDAQLIASKFEWFYAAEPALLMPPVKSLKHFVSDRFHDPRMEPPAVPPPRVA